MPSAQERSAPAALLSIAKCSPFCHTVQGSQGQNPAPRKAHGAGRCAGVWRQRHRCAAKAQPSLKAVAGNKRLPTARLHGYAHFFRAAGAGCMCASDGFCQIFSWPDGLASVLASDRARQPACQRSAFTDCAVLPQLAAVAPGRPLPRLGFWRHRPGLPRACCRSLSRPSLHRAPPSAAVALALRAAAAGALVCLHGKVGRFLLERRSALGRRHGVQRCVDRRGSGLVACRGGLA